ncbi:MAG: extracellular solute-binding protein [Clostridia bacterium]|nr:extracellular solute-binding protein [Clostridia bacterium]
MKKAGKMMATALALVSVFGSASALVGCGRRENGEEIDTTKTQLFVSTYAGGYGADWLYSLKERFETAYANESFEEGKTGVQIVVDDGESSGAAIALSANSNEVIFTESVPYYNWVKSKSLVDISDVVADVIAQEGVDLYSAQKEALTALDSKYYALPHYEGYYGIVYDKDLFDSASLYFATNGTLTNASGERTVGPDGKTGIIDGVDYTQDDGLPSTWEEFFTICQYMTQNGITPFILAGGCADAYSRRLLDRICAAYMGEEMNTWYSFDGTVDYVSSTTEATGELFGYTMTLEKGQKITEENGYLLRQMPGRLVALSVLQGLAEKDYFNTDALGAGTSHLNTQENYINSNPKNSPVAMMIEGSWWENEAKGAFERSIQNYPSYYPNKKLEDRNFGYMPLPTKINSADQNEGDSKLSMEYLRAYAFINKSSTEDWKIDLAKDFLRFAYSPESLEKYTEETGTVRAMQYKISDTTYNGLSTFGQDLWNTHKNNKVIYKLSKNTLYIDNEIDFTDTWGTSVYTSPFTPFRGGMSATMYYTGTLLTQASWDDSYSSYFNK